jgi:hypothetical protein
MAGETGLVDARIVDNHDIMRMKIRKEITKQPVFYRSSRTIDDHETRKVALFKRRLSDQPLRQLVVEVPNVHG